MQKLVAEIPTGDGFVRQVWEGATVADSFVVISLATGHASALRDSYMEISELKTREARIEAREKALQKALEQAKRAILPLWATGPF